MLPNGSMSQKILECVPNVSEGRDIIKIRQLEDCIKSVSGVMLLHTDIGKAANRTVFTFAGNPEAVIEAAFELVKKAYSIIDMSTHNGEHPRMGAVDVLPLVPIMGIGIEETVVLAYQLGKRIEKELHLSGYYYEYAATKVNRCRLENCRSGNYEGLQKKLSQATWKPDFGPVKFNSKFGLMALGVRKFLLAFNVNLDIKSSQTASKIASYIRESGRNLINPDTLSPELNLNGKPIHIPGSLRAVKALGWFIEDFNVAQVSMNLTDLDVTPMHIAFEEVKRIASEMNVSVTGSEIVGLAPLKSLIDAALFYTRRNSVNKSDSENIAIAIEYLGLNTLYHFIPEEKILDYKLKLLY